MLGISSLVNAFPYEVPSFIPHILLETAMKHSASPVPISTTIRAMLAGFKRSHQDSWAEDQKAFLESQLRDLHDLLTGSSYCEWVLQSDRMLLALTPRSLHHRRLKTR